MAEDIEKVKPKRQDKRAHISNRFQEV